MSFVGIDGCSAGWFLVSLDGRQHWQIEICATIAEVWQKHQGAELILIDIPIGLPHWRARRCDTEARKVLKNRRSSVFPVPSRDAIQAPDYQAACDINQRILGRKLSIQVWNISKKIKQLDDFLSDNEPAQQKIRESHPEICFWALAGGTPMSHPKRSEPGRRERLDLLGKAVPAAEEIYNAAVQQFTRKQLARDDILDALALAVTAAAPITTLATFPEQPERDQKNFPMEIVYTKQYFQ